MLWTLSLILLLLSLCDNVSSTHCPAYFTSRGDGCYRVLDELRSWPEHQLRCEQYGGQLATINSMEENNVLASWFGSSLAWIGLSSLSTVDGAFHWLSGNSTFTNWRTISTNSNHHSCVVTNSDMPGLWQSRECGLEVRAICEADPICENGRQLVNGKCSDCPGEVFYPPAEIICPNGYEKQGEGCYRYMPAYKTWSDHRFDCEQSSGWIATIETEEENRMLAQSFNSGLIYIGLNDLGHDQLFIWAHGYGTYFNWRNDPLAKLHTGKRNCVVTNKDVPGYWQHFDCNAYLPAICETSPVCASGSHRNPCGTCSACPFGTTSHASAVTVCDHCLDGFYSGDGHAPCMPCPQGYTNNELIGHTDCLQCVGSKEQCGANGIVHILDSLLAQIASMQAQIDDLSAGSRVTPTIAPSMYPSIFVTMPVTNASGNSTSDASQSPIRQPTLGPTVAATAHPTTPPSRTPSITPSSRSPSKLPTLAPTMSLKPSVTPSLAPTVSLSMVESCMFAGDSLSPGKCIISPSRRYTMCFGVTGDVSTNDVETGTRLWTNGVTNPSPAFLTFQADGNLVAYSTAGVGYWATSTYIGESQQTFFVAVQNDANMVVYDMQLIWKWACSNRLTNRCPLFSPAEPISLSMTCTNTTNPPTFFPSRAPSGPTQGPSVRPTRSPTTYKPTRLPSSAGPTRSPTRKPTYAPSL